MNIIVHVPDSYLVNTRYFKPIDRKELSDIGILRRVLEFSIWDKLTLKEDDGKGIQLIEKNEMPRCWQEGDLIPQDIKEELGKAGAFKKSFEKNFGDGTK